jgi:hypothetical protein
MIMIQKSLPLQTISKLSGSGACRNAAGMCQCRKEKDVFIISQYKNHNVTIFVSRKTSSISPWEVRQWILGFLDPFPPR